MEKANVFVLSKDKTYLEKEIIDVLCSTVEKQYEIANMPAMNHVMLKAAYEKGLPMANAHNQPTYLIGELEDSEYEPIIIAWDEKEDGMPAPRYMVGEYEINAVIEALEQNPEVDAWETIVAVNKAIRAKQ